MTGVQTCALPIYVVNLKLVHPDNDDVMIIADNGTIIRVRAAEISKMGRNTQGVKVMRMRGEGNVVAFTVVPHADEEEQDEQPQDPQSSEQPSDDEQKA